MPARRAYNDTEIEAAIEAVSDPESLEGAQRLVEDRLQRRSGGAHDPLGLLEARGIAEHLDGRLDLSLCVRTAVGHQAAS